MGRERKSEVKFRSWRALGFLTMLLVLSACSSGSENGSSDEALNSTYPITGSIGDGPIIDADIEVRDANGDVIATGTSDGQANYTIDIPSDAALPVTLHVTGGTDLVTNRSADFELVAMVNQTGSQTVNVSPLTSLAVKAAECRGDQTIDGMNQSWDDITRELNIGLDPVHLGDPMTQLIDENNVETAVLANESLGELVRRTGAGFGGAIPLDLIVDVLACDLADGNLDGQVVGSTGQDEARIFAVAKSAEVAIRLEVLAGRLEVDGEDSTAAMNAAIGTIMPEAEGADVNNVPITQEAIDDAVAAIDELATVLPDTELADVRATLVSSDPNTIAEEIDRELDTATLASLQGIPDRVAVLDEGTIDELAGNGDNSGGDSSSDNGDTDNGDTDNGDTDNGDTDNGGSDNGGSDNGGSDNGGSDNGGSNQNPPIVQLSVSDTTPAMNSSVVLSWSSTGADSCQASGSWSGSKSLSGQQSSGTISGAGTFTLTCSNSAGSDVAMVSVIPVGSLTVSWQAPTENVDGSPVSGISNYRIHYGTQSGQYDDVAEVSGSATAHTLNVPVGNYYIAMTAIDLEGDESGLSNQVTLTAQ